MRKLLRANFARLWKDKVFWGALVVLACYGVLGCISQYRLGGGAVCEDLRQFLYNALHCPGSVHEFVSRDRIQ